MKKIFYILFLTCYSCNASYPESISPLAGYTYLRHRTPNTTSRDKENTQQNNTLTGSPSKDKGQKPEVRTFLTNQAIKKGLFPVEIVPQ